MANADYEVPNQNESVIDGIAINPQGALSGQALIYDSINNQFIPGSSAGNVNGFFTAGQIAYATGTQSLAGGTNFVWDDTDGYLGIGTSVPSYQLHVLGDGYFTNSLIINGSSANISPSGAGAFRFNSGTNHIEFSENGGSWTQIGVGSVTSVSNSDGTLTISPTTGAVVASLNLGHTNNWSAQQTFSNHIVVDGYTFDLSGGAVNGQVLTYNGTSFVAQNATGGISGTLTNTKVPYATGSSTIADSAMAWDDTNKVLTVTTLTGNDGIQVTDSTHTIAIGVSASGGQLGTTTNDNLIFFTNNSAAQVTLNTSGYFGIGASPSYALHVVGDGYVTARTIYNGSSAAVSPSGTGAIRFNSGTNHLEFSENGGGWTAFGSGGGAVSSVSNSDSTLTVSPTTGAVVASLNLGNANTWTSDQTFRNIKVSANNTYSLGDSTNKFKDGYFAGILQIDGYNIDLSAGASNGQVLKYNGTAFVAGTDNTGGGGGSFGAPGEKFINVIPGAFYTSTSSTTYVVVGGFNANAGDYSLTGCTTSFVFRAVASLGSTTVTGNVKLRNVTDNTDVATLTFNGSTADTMSETIVTGSILASSKNYEIRISCSNVVNSSDFIQLISAELRAIRTIN